MSQQIKLMGFLCAALVMLSGAQTDRAGGTLPLRGGGTLPLRMPAEGTLPLLMSGDATAAVPEGAKGGVAMSVDIELGRATALPEVAEPACVQLFGPMWETADGGGFMIVGDEELEITAVCRQSLSGEVGLIAARTQSERAVSCFMTALTTTEDLTAVSGELTCSDTVAGLQNLTFNLNVRE